MSLHLKIMLSNNTNYNLTVKICRVVENIRSLIFFIPFNPLSVYSSLDAIESVIIFGMQFIAYCINFCYHVVRALLLTQSMILSLSEWRSQITENPSCDAHHPIIYKILRSNNNVWSANIIFRCGIEL